MEATFEGNHKTIVYSICNGSYPLLNNILKLESPLVVLVTTYATEHNRCRNMEATFKGNYKTVVYPRQYGNYIY